MLPLALAVATVVATPVERTNGMISKNYEFESYNHFIPVNRGSLLVHPHAYHLINIDERRGLVKRSPLKPIPFPFPIPKGKKKKPLKKLLPKKAKKAPFKLLPKKAIKKPKKAKKFGIVKKTIKKPFKFGGKKAIKSKPFKFGGKKAKKVVVKKAKKASPFVVKGVALSQAAPALPALPAIPAVGVPALGLGGAGAALAFGLGGGGGGGGGGGQG